MLRHQTIPPNSRYIRAENLHLIGDYIGSLNVLQSAENHDHIMSHSFYRKASELLLTARNYLCLHNACKVREYLNLIPDKIAGKFPQIDAEWMIIIGILYRREAHIIWKANDKDKALSQADMAITQFNLAEVAAWNAHDSGPRLLYNAQLNKLYTLSLKNAIDGTLEIKNQELIVQAVISEYMSRQHMTNKNRDHVNGTIIIADMAIGAKASIDDLRQYSSDPEYVIAYRAIFGAGKQSWPEFLMDICREDPKTSESPSRPDTIAKALLLGMRSLLAKRPPVNSDLLHSYAYLLRYHKDLLARKGSSLKIQQQIHKVFAHLPEQLRKHTVSYRVHR